MRLACSASAKRVGRCEADEVSNVAGFRFGEFVEDGSMYSVLLLLLLDINMLIALFSCRHLTFIALHDRCMRANCAIGSTMLRLLGNHATLAINAMLSSGCRKPITLCWTTGQNVRAAQMETRL